jgi:hypothetical protein
MLQSVLAQNQKTATQMIVHQNYKQRGPESPVTNLKTRTQRQAEAMAYFLPVQTSYRRLDSAIDLVHISRLRYA